MGTTKQKAYNKDFKGGAVMDNETFACIIYPI